jgi:hypothetical protein
MDNTPDPQPWRTDTIDGMVVEWDVGIRMELQRKAAEEVVRARSGEPPRSLVNTPRTASR